LPKDLSDVAGWQIVAQLATLLANLYELSEQFMSSSLVDAHTFTHRGARQIGEEQRTHDGRIATRLFGHAHGKSPKELRDWLASAAKIFDYGLKLGELHFGEGQQEVILAREVIEKRAFTDVGGVGDVLHSGVREAVLSEEIERSTEQAFADL